MTIRRNTEPVFWTKEETQECIELLSQSLGVPAPRLKVTGGWGGHYLPLDRTIYLGRRSGGGTEWSLLHEFAHHLEHMWYDLLGHLRQTYYIPASSRPKRSRYHGERFFNCLVDTVKAWYGDPLKYPWHMEYKLIQRRAFKAAYLPKPPKPTPKPVMYINEAYLKSMLPEQLARYKKRFTIVPSR